LADSQFLPSGLAADCFASSCEAIKADAPGCEQEEAAMVALLFEPTEAPKLFRDRSSVGWVDEAQPT
jgi:hypothetical protein